MLTYVINTSENKAFKTDLLFDLVGYNKISWMRCSLNKIGDTAEEIIERQQPMTAGEYRVVVLVDFLAFDKTLYPEENPVSEYLAIYKSLIEIYLHDHLYMPLRRMQLGFDGLEVVYIQYTEKNTIRENAAEKEQMADILGLHEEAERIRSAKEALRVQAEESDKEKGKKAEVLTKDTVGETLPRYETFRVRYRDEEMVFYATAFCKNLGNEKDATFDTFYRNFPEKYDIAYRAFGSRSRTYVASTASARSESRAAFDNLNLSLALIRAYEMELELSVDKGDDVVDVPKMNKERFFDTLRHSYGKVQSALEYVRQSGNTNGFYVLETSTAVSENICSDAMNEEEKMEVIASAKGMSLVDRYQEIKALASVPPGTKSEAEKKELSTYMGEYKQKRDEMHNHAKAQSTHSILKKAKKQNKYPSGLDYENAVEKKKTTMRRILKAAIDADYDGADYTEEFDQANVAMDKYLSGKARLEKYVRTNFVCFLLVMIAMLVPYFVFQMRESSFGAVLLLSIALAFFGGIFVLSAMLHVIPILRDIRSAKLEMIDLHEECLIKQRQSIFRLRKRYLEYLPAVEKIHYELAELSMLYEANRTINRHIEEHREMLENVRDVLLGMLTSMQIPHKADGDIALDDDEFKIDESFRQNSVYKVFTIDVIEDIFEERRM